MFVWVSMSRKCHNHELQTNPRHSGEETQITNSHIPSRRQLREEMGKSELVALLNLSSWCLLMVERLFLTVPRGCLWFVIVVFPDHTHLLF